MTRDKLLEAIDATPNVYVNFSFGGCRVDKSDLISAIDQSWPETFQETGLTLMFGNTLSWETG